jgi:hypothetical protein
MCSCMPHAAMVTSKTAPDDVLPILDEKPEFVTVLQCEDAPYESSARNATPSAHENHFCQICSTKEPISIGCPTFSAARFHSDGSGKSPYGDFPPHILTFRANTTGPTLTFGGEIARIWAIRLMASLGGKPGRRSSHTFVWFPGLTATTRNPPPCSFGRDVVSAFAATDSIVRIYADSAATSATRSWNTDSG